jgi:hypothetical protein
VSTPSPNNAFGTFLMPRAGAPIYFDCVLTEQVVRDAEITEFPVEVGANISDHYRVKLNEVKLEVFVSQEPIDNLRHPEGQGFWGAQKLITPPYPSGPVLATVAKAIVNPVGSLVSVVGGLLDGLDRPVTASPVLQWAAPFDSLQGLLTAIDAIRSAAGLVDIYTKSAVYTGFVIGNVTTNRDKEDGLRREGAAGIQAHHHGLDAAGRCAGSRETQGRTARPEGRPAAARSGADDLAGEPDARRRQEAVLAMITKATKRRLREALYQRERAEGASDTDATRTANALVANVEIARSWPPVIEQRMREAREVFYQHAIAEGLSDADAGRAADLFIAAVMAEAMRPAVAEA